MMRRIISLFLVFMMVAALIPTVSAVGNSVGLDVTSTGNTSALRAGDVVTVSVTLPEVDNFAGVNFDIVYDASKFTYNDDASSDISGAFFSAPDSTVRVLAMENTNNYTMAAGTVALSASFTVKPEVSGDAEFAIGTIRDLSQYPDDEYIPVDVDVTWPSAVTVSFADVIDVTVDDITIAEAGSYTGSALIPSVTVAGLTAADFTVEYYDNINAGEAAYVVVSPAEGGQYAFEPVTKYFTIGKAEVTVTAKNYLIFTGQTAPVLDDKAYSVSGFYGTDTFITNPTVAYDSTPDTSVAGTYNIVVSGAMVSDNYKINYVNGSLVISAKSDAVVGIASAPASVTYGDAEFNLSASVVNTGNNGAWTWTSSNTAVLTVDGNGKVTVVGAGKATITAKYESDTTIDVASVEITVKKATQSIRGRHLVVQPGQVVDLDQIFSAEGSLSYSVAGDSKISGRNLIVGDTLGTYALAVTAAETANYNEVTRGYDVIIVEKSTDEPTVTISYTLSFETNGGSAIEPVAKDALTIVNLADYVTAKDGYTFDGWYSDKELTNNVTDITLIDNMTVYAKWTEVIADIPCDGEDNCISHALSDVDQSQWYHESIDWVIENGIMQGVGDNNFDPHGVASRAMIVTILYRLAGQPNVNAENSFADVQDGTWYTDAVIWAATNGIVNGYGDGTFGPNDKITREQLAKIMYNYAEYKEYDVTARASLDSFTDADMISAWADEEMQWAVAIGLFTGMGDGTIAPQADAERCQVAAIFMRFCQKYEE